MKVAERLLVLSSTDLGDAKSIIDVILAELINGVVRWKNSSQFFENWGNLNVVGEKIFKDFSKEKFREIGHKKKKVNPHRQNSCKSGGKWVFPPDA